jgi:hypothetical protein
VTAMHVEFAMIVHGVTMDRCRMTTATCGHASGRGLLSSKAREVLSHRRPVAAEGRGVARDRTEVPRVRAQLESSNRQLGTVTCAVTSDGRESTADVGELAPS